MDKNPAIYNQTLIQSARALGYRVILYEGWADLALIDDAADCLRIGEVNQQALFKRVAAVVHHGGAGTTTTAALAGASQVIVPQLFDQFYWAQRALTLGIGVSHIAGVPSVESLIEMLKQALYPEVIQKAKLLSAKIVRNGAETAAKYLQLLINGSH